MMKLAAWLIPDNANDALSMIRLSGVLLISLVMGDINNRGVSHIKNTNATTSKVLVKRLLFDWRYDVRFDDEDGADEDDEADGGMRLA